MGQPPRRTNLSRRPELSTKKPTETPPDAQQLKITYRPTASLIPYARNARTHTPAQISQVAASIREFGWTSPVLVDGAQTIIAGHARVQAAQQLGMDEVPTIELSGLTEAQKRAYILADNRLAMNAGWDTEMLAVELRELELEEFDLPLVGFTGGEVDGFMAQTEEPAGLTDEDELPPETEGEPITEAGDVWLLGDHRLVCGDSTDPDAIAALMDGKRAQLVFTSPPYAAQRTYNIGEFDWTALMDGVFDRITEQIDKPGSIVINLGQCHTDGGVDFYWNDWLAHSKKKGWPLYGLYVWDKIDGMPGEYNGRLAGCHEWLFHFRSGKFHANKWVDTKYKDTDSDTPRNRDSYQRQKDGSMKHATSQHLFGQKTKIPDSVIRTRTADGVAGHPAPYPVALPEFGIKTWTQRGDVVLDPFGGSGTTMIACEKNGRRARLSEIDPLYCDIIVSRWEEFTGQKAEKTEPKIAGI